MATLPQLVSLYQDIRDHQIENPGHGINCSCMDKMIQKIGDFLGVPDMIHAKNKGQLEDFNRYIVSDDAKALRRITYVLTSVVRKL